MPTWVELLNELNEKRLEDKGPWLLSQQQAYIEELSEKRGRNVILFGSAFLQKPHVPPIQVSITHEDLNGLMTVIFGMDWSKGLTLVLHTPGGSTNAAESIVEYLRTKFQYIEVIVPTLAMSAGTMISLAANQIVMGRQSQLGPIDPQMQLGGGRSVSARAVVEQFDRAKEEVLGNPATAHVWAPILQSLGPSLLQEAQNALAYSEQIVGNWITRFMLDGNPEASTLGPSIAAHFNDASTHKSHGRRIDREEARERNVSIEDLETDQSLQETVLTLYHLMTISFENSPTVKLIQSNTQQNWVKNFLTPEEQERFMEAQIAASRRAGAYSTPAPGAKPARRGR